ncbi:MAG TPA: class I SAM-dependent methyltransferase [Acidimicrobiales bacterium]|nr:class I SAM-dependent methyltransferase [Acidimicrobiales bacterium]
MVTKGGWTPKLSLDVDSRRAKAAKIATLVERRRPLRGATLLEVGTGAGVIATLLADHVGPEGTVVSVDVQDLRTVTDGYQFELVDGPHLPFPVGSFDVVVSNHTIEHVGGPVEQSVHLCELARILRPGGVGYVASPSRWAVVEPHFKVPFLSWLPVAVRTPALRASGRGSVYDISPRTRREMRDLIARAGLRATDVTADAVQAVAELEPGGAGRVASRVPGAVVRAGRHLMPTMVFVVHR